MAESSVRAEQIQLGVLPEQRRQSRVHLPLSAQIFTGNSDSDRHTAELRDLNILGAFLYCDLAVAVGDAVRVALTPAIHNLNVNCEAKVVRVEEPALNGLAGVAVEFHNFDVHEPDESADEAVKPVAKWSAEMVDRKFARRAELQTYAARIQGAA